ncbi:MAG: aminotransferase class V-fold PLP-dependent enzyme [Desulfobacteraceae bacterium]|nr:aminotransferase class V-fold PLP-dependent enzyme [Desulfobacteraceae bacterium]
MTELIYLDNAATSFHKPKQVTEAMIHFMTEVGANPGRGGHELAVQAQEIVQRTRESLACLFNISSPERISFALNITEALNTVFHGFLNQGDHVITTGMEHNSVIRPLKYLEEIGFITLSIAPCDFKGILDIDALAASIQTNTALVALNHASNVCGTLQDVTAVKNTIGDIPLLVDTAQTAGCYPIDVEAMGIDFLAFTGHKSLMGPQGTGGLYVRDALTLRPLKRGGTGSVSEQLAQPDFFPDLLESGTQNNVGIAGLGAAVDFILETGIDTINDHKNKLSAAFIKAIFSTPGVTIYGPLKADQQVSTISITFDSILPEDAEGSTGCGAINLEWFEDGLSVGEAGQRLNSNHNILVRVGLHCAPLAHQTLGTYPTGTVRISMGYFNTLSEIEIAAKAINKIAAT